VHELKLLLDQAEEALSRGDVDAAALAFKQAYVVCNGVHPLPSIGLARVALLTGRPQLARAVVDRVLTVFPRLPAALLVRGAAEEQLQGPAAAADWYRRALAEDPASGLAALQLGRVEVQLGDAAQGLARLRAAAEQHPQSVDLWHALGTACWNSGQRLEGLAALTHALELDTDNVQRHVLVANLLAELGNHALADELLEAASQKFPAAAILHSKRAALALLADDVASARTHAHAATRAEPGQAEWWLQAAGADLMSADFESCARCAARAIDLAPGDWRGYFQLGMVAEATKDLPHAAAAYTQAIARDGSQWRPHNNLGLVYLHQQRFAEARQALQRAIELGPAQETLAARYNLALALFNLGETAASARQARDVVNLGPADTAVVEDARRLATALAA
jgi:tetratricopeptide (TPR) repeat protein